MQNQMFGIDRFLSKNLNVKSELIRVLSDEAGSIFHLIENFPEEAEFLVSEILQTKGRVVFSGMGKSGLIAKKLVATFSSLGTASMFLHPSEALHGDLGMVRDDDFFISLSKSGTGPELVTLLSSLSKRKVKTSLICSSLGYLTKYADLVVQLPLKGEACSLNLAPTNSSTLMLAFGDALAVVVSKLKKFTKEDFARFHPAGALGKRLLSTVSDFIQSEKSELPFISPDSSFADLLVVITSKKLGIGIVSEGKKLLGIITDGDLRRSCKVGPLVFGKLAKDIMHLDPKTIDLNALAFDALKIMENNNITTLIVTEEENVVGIVHIHDLIKAGIKE